MAKDDLKEYVFAPGPQPAPGGTAAVLTRPSALSMDLAEQAVRAMPLDGLYRDIGAVAARVVADELESRALKPSDYATLPNLPKVVAKRIVGYILRSEEFARSFSKHLSARG